MKFDPKTHKTRAGYPWRMLADDLGGDFPISIYIYDYEPVFNPEGTVERLQSNGRLRRDGKDSFYDLIPIEPEIDWQRVIDGKYDVRAISDSVGTSYTGWQKLISINLKPRQFNCEFGLYSNIEIRREPGHRQPHFGDEYPSDPNDYVVVNQDLEELDLHRASEIYWPRVREYIVIREAKDV